MIYSSRLWDKEGSEKVRFKGIPEVASPALGAFSLYFQTEQKLKTDSGKNKKWLFRYYL